MLGAVLAATVLAIFLFGIPLVVVVGRLLDESATLRIEREAVLASRSVPIGFVSSSDPVELPTSADGVAFGLYDLEGALVAGEGPARADAVTERALRDEVADSEVGEARVVAIPVTINEQVVGAVRAEQSTALGDARTRRILGWLAGLAAGVVGVGLLAGWVVAGRLTRPVLRLRDAAVRLGDGDFAVAISPSGVEELDEAARALQATALRLDELIARERTFTADVSHQLRTPLAGLRAAVETELAFPNEDTSQFLEDILDDVDRLDRTVTDLLELARSSRATVGSFRLSEVLEELEQTWKKPFQQAGRVLQVESGRFSPPAVGSTSAFRHILDVLVANGLRHGRGMVRVSVRVQEDSVAVYVTDEGAGFSDSPFDPARPLGEGRQRLGLQLAKRLADSMLARISLTRLGPRPEIVVTLRRADVRSRSD